MTEAVPLHPTRPMDNARERLDSFARLSGNWLWETDSRHAVSYLSPPALRAIGRPEEELLGRPFERLAASGPASGEILARFEAGLAFHDLDVRLQLGDGSELALRLSGEPMLCGGSRRFLGFRGIGQVLVSATGREAELHRALEAAEARSRAKSHFLASMSHELRTPLNAIIGFSEIMRDEHFGPIGAPRYQGYAGDVHDSARHLLRLINDILDLAKIEAGKLVLEEEQIEPVEMLRTVLRLAAPMGHRAQRESAW